MAKQEISRAGATGRIVTVKTGKSMPSATVKFGNVTIKGARPSKAAIKSNIERSSKALERVSEKLLVPGVTLRERRDVPRFSAAEEEKGVFIRRLNGVTQRGRLVDGQFQVID